MNIMFYLENKPAAQTLPNATPQIGKMNLFSKIAITFEAMMFFYVLQD